MHAGSLTSPPTTSNSHRSDDRGLVDVTAQDQLGSCPGEACSAALTAPRTGSFVFRHGEPASWWCSVDDPQGARRRRHEACVSARAEVVGRGSARAGTPTA